MCIFRLKDLFCQTGSHICIHCACINRVKGALTHFNQHKIKFILTLICSIIFWFRRMSGQHQKCSVNIKCLTYFMLYNYIWKYVHTCVHTYTYICDLICKNPEQSRIYGYSVSCIFVLYVL